MNNSISMNVLKVLLREGVVGDENVRETLPTSEMSDIEHTLHELLLHC